MYYTQSFEAQVCKRHYYMYKVWNKRVYPQIPSIGEEMLEMVVKAVTQFETCVATFHTMICHIFVSL